MSCFNKWKNIHIMDTENPYSTNKVFAVPVEESPICYNYYNYQQINQPFWTPPYYGWCWGMPLPINYPLPPPQMYPYPYYYSYPVSPNSVMTNYQMGFS